ncbi:hypothetical protein [Paraburkholderia elongata]|uniref:Uncharacterized protein n=1 Tax=Paraburkholderia elongata TaxID=2675747 RepID=A0A972NL48_9BURK|nr:hypothetical protein [Paraburkholderia elongata]NPT54907.1 hypothetical protein [Paraburkholderia elongata]NPT60936.1 hypothetical protein [Paraburkholderia elongata]
MTTAKQAAANQQNAQKSTGPLTPQGKTNASSNALKHGVLSARLFLDDENPEEFQLLLDGLQASLRPSGSLELVLVERIAVTMWRQQRLIRAETAGIELARRLDAKSNRRQIENAMGIVYPKQIEDGDLEPPPDDDGLDAEYLEYCEMIVREYHHLDRKVLEANDITHFEQVAPTMYAALREEADEANVSVTEYVQTLKRDLLGWVNKTVDSCCFEMEHVRRRTAIAEVADFVRSRQSAPINHELLCKYQTALDGELYRAIRALRDAQEWRLKTLDDSGAIAT